MPIYWYICWYRHLQNTKKRRIVVGQEKVGVEGEDYTLHYYKRKIGIRMKQRTRKTGTGGTSETSGTGASGD